MEQDRATKRFYELVWPHRATVLRTAHMLAHNPANAEDLAQETLLKAFRKLDSFRDGTDMKAWLLAILRNNWVDEHRRAASRHETVSLDELAAEPAAGASRQAPEQAASRDVAEALNALSDQQLIDALKQLPDETRWTLLLVDVEGLSQAEAADVLDVSVGTVKSRTHRGHAALRNLLLPVARDRWMI